MTPWLVRCVIGVALWHWVPLARAQDTTAESEQTAPSPQGNLSPASIADALQRYAHEPSVTEVMQAAVKHQRSDPRRVAALASRARVSGWLPTFRVSASRGQTIALLAAQSTTIDRNSATTGDNLVLQAQLTWDLARVVWGNQELRVEREQRAERQAQHELMRWVSALYFERRRMQIERDVTHTVSVTGELRILEIEGLLDGLTGGAFSHSARERRRTH